MPAEYLSFIVTRERCRVGGAAGKLRGFLLHFLFLLVSRSVAAVLRCVYNDVGQFKEDAFTRLVFTQNSSSPTLLHLFSRKARCEVASSCNAISSFDLITRFPFVFYSFFATKRMFPNQMVREQFKPLKRFVLLRE